MAHDVFISYSSADKAVADAVCATLEQKKIRCWIAPRDVLAGTTWSESIVRAINGSKVMVLIFSGKANASVQIKREVERAVNKAIPILPFRIENVLPTGDLEYFLSLPHWLDAMTQPMEDHLKHLAKTVKALLEQPKAREAAASGGGLKTLAAPRKRNPWLIAGAVALLVGFVGLGLWALGIGRARTFKDFSMKMVKIPAGEFRMGSDVTPKSVLDQAPGGEPLSDGSERPAHRVKISRPFYMGAHEVTVGQFRAFVDATGHKTDAEELGEGEGLNPKTRKLNSGPAFNWKFNGLPQTDDHPVVNVSWNDATAFCKWMSKKEGATYRLPTEAEWEYACRAGSNSFFGLGDDTTCLEGHANLADAALRNETGDLIVPMFAPWNDRYPYTAPVGQFKANAWGLYDMHGNVTEWCADSYEAYRPEDQVDPLGSGPYRVCRGSCWHFHPVWSGASHRNGPPEANSPMNTPQYRSLNYGFRVVKEVQP